MKLNFVTLFRDSDSTGAGGGSTGTTNQLSFGEKAVGLSFNPGNDPRVEQAKRTMAKAIDQMHDLRNTTESPEIKRLASVAITELQGAQMWAVKAITWKD